MLCPGVCWMAVGRARPGRLRSSSARVRSGFCVVPSGEAPRAGGPTSTVASSNFWGYAVLDLSGIDRKAEVEAFRQASEEELRKLAEAVGREPVLRWGSYLAASEESGSWQRCARSP